MSTFAPKIAYQTLDTPLTVESGVPILVFGYLFTNNDSVAGSVTITNNSSVEIGYLYSAGATTAIVNIPFVADDGLVFTSDTADVNHRVAVFYSISG